MALWAKVQKLTGDQIQTVQAAYGVHFPIEVRHFFAQWIEQQPWLEIDENKPDHESQAERLRDLMLDQLAGARDDAFINETAQQFREMYSSNPMNLVRVVKNCLQTELRCIQQTDKIQQLEVLEWYTQDTANSLRELQHKLEAWLLQSQESDHISVQLNQLACQPSDFDAKQRLQEKKRCIDSDLSRTAPLFLYEYVPLLEKYQKTCIELQEVHRHILEHHRIPWNRQQQSGMNPSALDGSLDALQQWYDTLSDLTWRNFEQIEQASALRTRLPTDIPPEHQGLIPSLVSNIKQLLEALITNSFVIEKQPPQVLKKDARFSTTLRCLIGRRRHLQMTLPQVTANIVSEDQARCIIKEEPGSKALTSGDIINNKGTMEYHQASDQMSITFRNMALKRIRRAEKKGNETVTEEKFSIFFQMELTVNSQLTYQVWTLSLPVVVTVHGNQECNAQATVLWDNSFADTIRIPFHVPDKVLWPDLAGALNTRFQIMCSLELSHEHLLYLASKLFGNHDDYSSQVITWSQFNREPLPDRSFTFWEWFHSVLKLTKDWLIGPWKDKLIIGFISKRRAEEWLMKAQIGTFLLRFSDSELGGLSCAWVQTNENGEPFVRHLAPYTDKDLRTSGLGDRIKDPSCLLYLYPDIPKEQAFSKFWSNSPGAKKSSLANGYVKPDLMTSIPGSQPAFPMDGSRTPGPLSPTPSDISGVTSPLPPAQPQQPTNSVGLLETDDSDIGAPLAMLDYTPENIDEIHVRQILNFNTAGRNEQPMN